MKKILNSKLAIAGMTLVAGIFLGWLFFSGPNQASSETATHDHSTSEVWTCSMHPSVRQSEPGKCPICGMDLIPLENDDEGDDPIEVKMSATAIRLASIRTMTIGVNKAEKEIRLNGKVQADERNMSSQSAHIPGRIEKLLVNFTGEPVTKGAVIAYVYSPELVTAQQELFEAYKIKDAQPALYNAAREKLKNWKLSDKQIDEIIATGKPKDQFPIIADASGIVMKRNVSVGDYVSRGMSIYDLVNLSRVWVLFDVYENDMQWVRKGSKVDFTVQSLPGEKFTGKVSFIDPVIDPKTRVATARLEMVNPGQKLKPEMFTTGVVTSDFGKREEIIVPKSAVMWTGERSIVYLKKESDKGVSFRLQEVVLGPSLGESYVINEGLEPGMEIVVNGTFTIDAAAQLAGKPSMMSPEGGTVMTGHQHGETAPAPGNKTSNQKVKVNEKFRKQLMDLLDPYLRFKDALVQTDPSVAKKEAKSLATAFAKVDMSLLGHESHTVWMPLHNNLKKAIDTASSSNDVEVQRTSFSTITNAYFEAINTFGLSGLDAYYQYCPMAFDNKGGYWISKDEDIKNPYFGSKMMRCGETKQEIK